MHWEIVHMRFVNPLYCFIECRVLCIVSSFFYYDGFLFAQFSILKSKAFMHTDTLNKFFGLYSSSMLYMLTPANDKAGL